MTGERGDTGQMGQMGERGPKGDHGQHGETGATGERGIAGLTGKPGWKGFVGYLFLVAAFVVTGVGFREVVQDNRAAIQSLCAQQKILDGLTIAAIALVSEPPNPPGDKAFVEVFEGYHRQIINNKDCNPKETP